MNKLEYRFIYVSSYRLTQIVHIVLCAKKIICPFFILGTISDSESEEKSESEEDLAVLVRDMKIRDDD